MRFLFVFGLVIVTVYGKTVTLYNSEAIINAVNNAQTTWKAGHNFAKDMPLRYIKNLLGVKLSNKNSRLPIKSNKHISNSEIPEEFDSRKQWPNCPTISHIADQGMCGSCWAVGAATAFSDRACISSGGKFTQPLSAEELLSCCDECGDGCNGASSIAAAWEFFQYNGIVTGGDYNSSIGCQPYQLQPCEHYTTGKRPQCPHPSEYSTPECQNKCINGQYQKGFKSDHHKVRSAYSISSEVEEIQKEIMTGGPVEVAFTVYEDFINYKEGVYQYTTGDVIDGHAVRLIGWGTEKGTPYWLIANSWNTDWGDNGLFKIIRGQDDCGIESNVQAGDPINK